MKKSKCLMAIALLILCSVISTGCSSEKEEGKKSIVYKFGNEDISYGEFYIYAKTVEEDYQKAYGKGIWSLELESDDGKSTVRDITIIDLINDINRVKVLVEHAEELNISLGDNEKAEADQTATEFYKGLTEKDIEEMEITKNLLVKVIEENMLAAKVYDHIISEYDFEISEEEARMTTFFDIIFECNTIKEDGTVEEYTDEKKAAQLERANEALAALAQGEGVSCDDIVNKYNLQYSAYYTMSKAALIEEYGELIADKVLSLSDGEVSTVMESDYGYHIFKMEKSKDDELTKKNKEQIIAQKQKEYFNGVYGKWEKEYDSHFVIEGDVDMELAGKFPFSE